MRPRAGRVQRTNLGAPALSGRFEDDEQERIEQARRQPYLRFLSFDSDALLERLHREDFPDVEQRVRMFFTERGPLACILFTRDEATIYVHQVLNHADTPELVLRHVIKHELLHLRIPSEFEDGKEEAHPEAFWEAEEEVCPESTASWAWIMMNLILHLRRRPRLQRIDVLPSWRHSWYSRRKNLDDVEAHFGELPGRGARWWYGGEDD